MGELFIARGPTYVNNTVELGKCAGVFCRPFSVLRGVWDGGCQ